MWAGSTRGPPAPPGRYQVRVTAGGVTKTQEFADHAQRGSDGVTDADLQAQFTLASRSATESSAANDAVIRIRDMKEQIADAAAKANGCRHQGRGRRH